MPTIKLRRGTSAQWANANPILAVGEPGHDVTNRGIKFGDGVTPWLELGWFLQTGADGKSAYQVAVDHGFEGTESEWLTSLIGPEGRDVYQVALDNGFIGTESAWLNSLIGDTGAAGPANVLTVGTVTTGAAGSSAAANIDGVSPNQTLDLTIPKGDKGDPGVGLIIINYGASVPAGTPAGTVVFEKAP